MAFNGGAAQHIVPPHAWVFGDAHVHAAGVPAHVGVPPLQFVVQAPQ
jgi:hypothetical protein